MSFTTIAEILLKEKLTVVFKQGHKENVGGRLDIVIKEWFVSVFCILLKIHHHQTMLQLKP